MAAKKMPKQATEKERTDSGEEITLCEHRAMIYLPEDSVEVTITAKIYVNGNVCEVGKVMSMSDLREAFRKADDGYIDDDDTFFITEKGKAYLDEVRNG